MPDLKWLEPARPEYQYETPDRLSLNLKKPGSFLDERAQFYRRNHDTQFTDYLNAIPTGLSEIPKAVGDLAYYGGKQIKESTKDIPILNYLGKGTGGILETAGAGVKAVADPLYDWNRSHYSEGAINAMEDGTGAGWALNGLEFLPSLVGSAGAGAATKALAKGTVKALTKHAVEKRLVKQGVEKSIAKHLATDSAEHITGGSLNKHIAANLIAQGQGQAADAAYKSMMNITPQELAGNPDFVNEYQALRRDPKNRGTDDADILEMARRSYATRAAMSLSTDPGVLAANVVGTMYAHIPVIDMFMKGASRGITRSALRSAGMEAAAGALQGGAVQESINNTLTDSGFSRSPYEGVTDAMKSGAVMGAVGGGIFGGVGAGINKRQHAIAVKERKEKAEQTIKDKYRRASELAEKPQADADTNWLEKLKTADRETALEHYTQAELASETDPTQKARANAASERIKQLDMQDDVDKLKDTPTPELQKQYHELNASDKKSKKLPVLKEALRQRLETEGKADAAGKADSAPEQAQPAPEAKQAQQEQTEKELVKTQPLGNSEEFKPAEATKAKAEPAPAQPEKAPKAAPVSKQAAATQAPVSTPEPVKQVTAPAAPKPAPQAAPKVTPAKAAKKPVKPAAEPDHLSPIKKGDYGGALRITHGDYPEEAEALASNLYKAADKNGLNPKVTGAGSHYMVEMDNPHLEKERRRLQQAKAAQAEKPAQGELALAPATEPSPAPAPKAAQQSAPVARKIKFDFGIDDGDGFAVTHGQTILKDGFKTLTEAADYAENPSNYDELMHLLAQHRKGSKKAAKPANKEPHQEPDKAQPDSKAAAIKQPDNKPAKAADNKTSPAERASEPAAKAAGKAEKIEDFGEKLEGAKKHREQLTRELSTSIKPEEAQRLPLSKLFPQPDYVALAKSGADSGQLAAVALLRHMVKRDKSSAPIARESVARILNGEVQASDHFNGEKTNARVKETFKMLSALPPELMSKAEGHSVMTAKAADGRTFYYLDDVRMNYLKSETPEELHAKVIEHLSNETKGKGETQFSIYKSIRDGSVYIGYGKNRAVIKDGFKNPNEARDYLNNNRQQLEETLQKLREETTDSQRGESNRERTGKAHRTEDITPEKFSSAFGFRGVQFGNYVEGARRQSDLNSAYDALHDLAQVLNVPARALSLNGELGLAFGARGSGKAMAHYEPSNVVINLTKSNGAGSLGHEWFHALDNFLGTSNTGSGFISGQHLPEGARREMFGAFSDVIQAVKKSPFAKRSKSLDQVRTKPYWTLKEELSARAFEVWLKERMKKAGTENDFLVNIRDDAQAYPTKAEMDGGITQAFDRLFSTLQLKETDRGITFYSKLGKALVSETGKSKEKPEGIPVRQAEIIANSMLKGVGDTGLKVKVVKTQEHAEALSGEKSADTIHAMYLPEDKTIVLVADNLKNGNVREKMRHELIHHALERLLSPDEYKGILKQLDDLRSSKNPEIRKMWQQVEANYPDAGKDIQNLEFLAHMAEKHQTGKFGMYWDRFVTSVKNLLRKAGIISDYTFNDMHQVRETLHSLSQRLRSGYEGGEVKGNTEVAHAKKRDPFKAPEQEVKDYNNSLNRIMENRRELEFANLGRTPPLLRHLGAPNLPVRISRGVIHKATEGRKGDDGKLIRGDMLGQFEAKHFVKIDTIKKLPELMHDPLAVYDSNDKKLKGSSLLLWLDAVDKYNDPVIVALHYNGGKYDLEINPIASVYGTEGGMDKINRLEEQGLALYRSDKLNPVKADRIGLQLPSGGPQQGSGKRVLSSDDIRKQKFYSKSKTLTTWSDLEPENTVASRLITYLQDKFHVLKGIQDNIIRAGGRVTTENDAYLAEEAHYGKTENDLNNMKRRYVEPLAKLLSKYEISRDQLDEYLYARHAPERNAYIAKINPDFTDGGSGMKDAQAIKILNKVKASGKQKEFDRLAELVDGMLNDRREIMKQHGLQDEETLQAWQSSYKYYVPLKGFAIDHGGRPGSRPRTGAGLSTGGKESRRALGRGSEANSPVIQSMQDLTETIIRARKNEVGNTLLRLVTDNPDRDYWQVFTKEHPDKAPRWNEQAGRVVSTAVDMEHSPDYFPTKRNGKTYYIKLHDYRLMDAMKNMSVEKPGLIIRYMAAINRFTSAMATSYNPVFLVKNFIRDQSTAHMFIQAEVTREDGKLKNIKDPTKFALKAQRGSLPAMRAIHAALSGKKLTGEGAKWQKSWDEFLSDGGKTGWVHAKSFDSAAKDMDKIIKMADGGFKGMTLSAVHRLGSIIEQANSAVENALRLSVYRNAIEAGVDRKHAASIAKNLTVNFNRKGNAGTLMNAIYMFSNASIQGTANVARAFFYLGGNGKILSRMRWKNLNNAQKIGIMSFAASLSMGTINRIGGGQDEDGQYWYDKVPDFDREHNIIIMKSLLGGAPGAYWKIPLPFGYNYFWNFGDNVNSFITGHRKAGRFINNSISSAFGAFSPLGGQDSKSFSRMILKNITPSAFTPWAAWATNEDFRGNQIMSDYPGNHKPASMNGRRGTGEAYKRITEFLNKATGGDDTISGGIDISPDKLAYLVAAYTSGPGRVIDQTLDIVHKSLTSRAGDIRQAQIPFWGQLNSNVLPYADTQRLYERMDRLAQIEDGYESLTGTGKRLTKFVSNHRDMLGMRTLAKQTRSQLRRISIMRSAIYANSNLTPLQVSERIKLLDARAKKITDNFNKTWDNRVHN